MVDMGLGFGGQSMGQWDELEGGDLPAIIQLARQQVAQLTKALEGRQGSQELGIARQVRELAWLLGDMDGRYELQGQQMARLDLLMGELARRLDELPRGRG